MASGLSLGQDQRDPDAVILDPVGTWRCVLYGNPALGEERVLLSFSPDHTARVARSTQGGAPTWSPLSAWEVEDDTISFSDSRSGRRFRAGLRGETLSGEWRTLNLLGGWWCVPTEAEAGSRLDILSESNVGGGATKRLIPEIMATPSFPVQAIREAKEGRVVLCFVVHPTGEVFDPEFLELSDELFRAPSLDALMRSRYQAWDPRTDGGPRPACRSFIFKLDYVF